MNLLRIEPDSIVRTPGMPLYYPGGEEAVLLIHGFTGSPRDMQYLAERLHEAGYTVSVPRLPGHGTNGTDFLQSDWRMWLRACVDAHLELASRHETVHVGGLSMGGVLALLLHSRFRKGRLALLAPAVTVRDKLIYLTPLVRLLFPKIRRTHQVEARDPEEAALEREYQSHQWPAAGASLLRLQLMARRCLGRVQSETLTVVSENDETVSPNVARYIDRRINAASHKVVVLKESPHVVVDDIERETVADHVLSWFKAGVYQR
jgi:carboxylesterase